MEHHPKNESKKYCKKKIQDITQEFKPRINACRDPSGKILSEKEDIERIWKEYFESILKANQEGTDSIFSTAENEDVQPSYGEVTHVIKRLKNYKVPGTDQILAELLRIGGETLWRKIHNLIKLIWVKHKMPEEWSMGIIQPMYKKGDKLECSSYTAITLLSVTYKVLSGILYNRLTVYAEEILGEYQCGFRAN